MLVIFLVTLLLLLLWAYEFFKHRQNIVSIPRRIHVNGTRGKSSVTRLIAAGLRAGGLKTLAKTTGTLPRVIDEKGLEIPIQRPKGTNIIEQLGIMEFIAKRKPDALVIECMAVQPEFQWVCEHQMIKSSVGVITNSRLDHIREMGPSIENITRSLCNTIPKDGIVYTSEKKMLPLMKKTAEKIGADLRYAEPDLVKPEDMMNFSYVEHQENIALALAVCQHYGVDKATALQGMYSCHPDAGALRVIKLEENGRQYYFINALAANDPESTLEIWKKVDKMYPSRDIVLLQLNSRADRYDRSLQLLEIISGYMRFDYLLLTGEVMEKVRENAVRMRIPKSKIAAWGKVHPEEFLHKIEELVPSSKTCLIMAIGNAGGGGLAIANYFKKRAEEDKLQITNNK
ncbi:poly-gamma-glutamate synthase PgsB [bacterium]|nr:poly-gamma-glutamate synthase PgsB [bacterium]